MSEKKPDRRGTQEQYRCEFDHYPESTPCVLEGKVELDSLMLCEKHALEGKLEGQITCWEAMLAHIDLWSREASRRDRPDIVRCGTEVLAATSYT